MSCSRGASRGRSDGSRELDSTALQVGSGRSDRRPAERDEVISPRRVMDECASTGVVLVAVVLDRNLHFGIGRIDPGHKSWPVLNRMLQHRIWEAVRTKDLDQQCLGLARRRSMRMVMELEDATQALDAWSTPTRRSSQGVFDRYQARQLSSQGRMNCHLDRAVAVPSSDAQERLFDGRDWNPGDNRQVARRESEPFVHYQTVVLRPPPSRAGDLQDSGRLAREIPERGRRTM